jgi:signal transduction histidine kinase
VTVGPIEDGFYVADDGPGIPEDQYDEVLERGFTTSDTGTGLGLSIVRTVVDAHGWDITVTSSTDGGARFEITGATATGVVAPTHGTA